jgi:DNA-binding Lrp family transcriptional regulator
LCTAHVSEVADVLSASVEGLGDIIAAKALTTRLNTSYYGVRSLTRSSTEPSCLVVGGRPGLSAIDDTDHKLLYHLARGEGYSVRELARVSGIPYTTVERRKQKLEESGVIEGYIYRVALDKLGCRFAKLRLKQAGVNAQTAAALSQFCREHPEVVGSIECIGPWDYELNLALYTEADLQKTSAACRECLGENVELLPILWMGTYRKRHNYPFYKN